MTLGREIGKKVGSVLLVSLLGLLITLTAVTDLTTREGVGELAKPVIENTLLKNTDRAELNNAIMLLSERCVETRFPTADLPFQESIISLDCEELREVKNKNYLDAFSRSFIDGFYYAEYSCGFLDCIRSGDFSNYFVLVSEQGHETYKGLMWLALVLVIIGGTLVFVFSDTWIQRTWTFGVAFFMSSIGFVAYKLFNYFSQSKPGNEVFEHLISLFHSKVELKLIIAFIIGVALLVATAAMKEWQIVQGKHEQEKLTREQQWADYYREYYR